MSPSPLVPIVLGHNQFSGVNHLSAARGAERAAQFTDPMRALEIIRHAQRQGAAGLMFSTNEQARAILPELRREPGLAELRLYPLLPHLQKYVRRSNQVGMVNMVLESLAGMPLGEKVTTLWRGGLGVLGKDVEQTLRTLIRLELEPFRGLRLAAVFLHDGLTDLILALGLRGIASFYLEEIERSFGARGAFATKNLPTLVERFTEWQLPAPVVMTHFNAAGFHMNPSQEACEVAAASRPAHIMAMGTLASGHLRPEAAYAYLAGVANIESVVVGASTPRHIDETFGAITRHLGSTRARQIA